MNPFAVFFECLICVVCRRKQLFYFVALKLSAFLKVLQCHFSAVCGKFTTAYAKFCYDSVY